MVNIRSNRNCTHNTLFIHHLQIGPISQSVPLCQDIPVLNNVTHQLIGPIHKLPRKLNELLLILIVSCSRVSTSVYWSQIKKTSFHHNLQIGPISQSVPQCQDIPVFRKYPQLPWELPLCFLVWEVDLPEPHQEQSR